MSDTSCAVFARDDIALDPDRIHRFVVGEDDQPRAMSPAEAEGELGDPFATLVLLQGQFPRTAEQAVTAIKEAAGEGDLLRNQMSFVLGEGSQIPFDTTGSLQRGLRFVVTLGATADGPPDGPDVLVSVFDPGSKDIELMAWDRRTAGFNYYRAMGDPPAWVFAGNARHALAQATEGKGPFESHPSGALLMKELKIPWVHWDSPDAHIFASVFAPDDERSTHEWFTNKEPGGAYAFEFEVARPAIERWQKVRFASLAAGEAIDRPGRIMQQIVATPTANLASSNRESRAVGAAPPPIDLPATFFVDADGLREVGLQGPAPFEVANEIYQASLETFAARLEDGNGFVRKGDTHFAFVILERALEDELALREAIRIGLVSRRLAACLLMTDFPNPVFSDRRATLLAHVPPKATLTNGSSSFSQEMADAILAAAKDAPAGSPHAEFANHWNVGESFDDQFNALLNSYYDAVRKALGTQDGFDDYFRLAESRRQRGIVEMPILRENKLLFAQTNLPPAARLQMQPDGSVV